jgi:hypothetical protein
MIVAAVSFFLLLFLSLRRAVEMWETPQADQALATNIPIDHSMVNRRHSSQGQSRRRDAYSDVVLRGLGYKECIFPVRSTKERNN